MRAPASLAQFVACRLRCPICATEFVADEIFGVLPSHRETDFRLVYDGPDPLHSHLHACPQCRYAAYREGFETHPTDEDELLDLVEDDPRSLPRPTTLIPDDEEIADLRRYIRSGEFTDGLVAAGRESFGAERYLLAARVHEFVAEEDPLGVAHFILRAAWCARGARDKVLERRSLKELAGRLHPLVENGQPSDSADRIRLLYLAGEVARRTGDFARASDLFSMVEREADADEEEGAFLCSLARRQAMLTLIKSEVNAVIPPALPTTRGHGHGDDEEESFDEDDGGNSLN